MILSASVGSGHNIAASVLESYLQRHPDVDAIKKLDILETTNELYRTFYDDAYFTLVDSVPWLVGWGYDANDSPFKLGNSASLWDRINTTSAAKAIRRFRPDVVICTHFLPTRMVTLMITRGVLEATLAVVTTDYDFQGLWLSSPFNHFFVAREETKAHMVGIGVPADRLTVSGIPVKAVLGEPVNAESVLNRYRLVAGVPTLLISAGAAGGAYTRTIVQQTLRMKNRFQAIVVCGRNDRLKREVKALVAGRPEYRVLGYTTDMADLMRAATLFIGKPGGLSSSECMAAGLPMVLIKPIPGQEERNSNFLLEEGAAVRCTYETTVGFKIDRLLGDPDRIRRMAARARQIGYPGSAAQIATMALAEPPAPLWISRTAQKSILSAGEQGMPTMDLDPERRTRALVDSRTGVSVGVVTSAQLRHLTPIRDGVVRTGTRVLISESWLRRLHRERTDPDLLLTLRRILGRAQEIALDVHAD